MPREQDRIPLSLEVILDSSSGKREARISDISLGGCYVDTITPAGEGESVSLQIRVPATEEMIPFTGTVVYSMEQLGFGVRFTDMTDKQRAFLEEIVGKE